MPALVIDGRVIPIQHISQIASTLGLAFHGNFDAPRIAWDCVTILTSWIEDLCIDRAWGLLNQPTPSRQRSTVTLAVNSFHPFERLPKAFDQTTFAMPDADDDSKRQRTLQSPDDLVAYLESVLFGWQGFLLDKEDELSRRNPALSTTRGELSYSALLDANRWHAAFHHRQVARFFAHQGIDLSNALDVEALPGLDLPADVY